MTHRHPSHSSISSRASRTAVAGHDAATLTRHRGRWPLAGPGRPWPAMAISRLAATLTAVAIALVAAATVAAVARPATKPATVATLATATTTATRAATAPATGQGGVVGSVATAAESHSMATAGPLLAVAASPVAGSGPAPEFRGLVPGAAAPQPGLMDQCQISPPAPALAAPAPAPAPERPSSNDQGWLAGVWSAASSWFADQVVLAGVDPLLRLLGGTVLAAPDPSCMPGMVALWQSTRTIAVGLFGLLVLAGAVLVMAQGSLQTRYGVRELLPRVVLAFGGANLSLWLVGQAVTAANALTVAVLGTANTQATATGLRDTIVNADSQGGGLWLIFVVAALLVLVVIVLLGYVQRLALLAILTVAAPLALACHALPGLDRLATWWWRALAATLGAQFAQALTFVIALRVFLAPGGLGSGGQLAEPTMRLFLALGVVAIMAVIPVHVMRAAKIGQGGSLIGSVIRTVLAVKTLGVLRAGAHGAAQRGARRGIRPTTAGARGRPRTMARAWPFGSGTAPAGRTLAEARRARRDHIPPVPRPRPDRLNPPNPPGPRPEPGRLHPPRNTWATRQPGSQGRTAPHSRPTPPPAPPPAKPAVRRQTGRVDPPRAGGRAAPPRSHPRTPPASPRPPRRRPNGPRRQP